MIDCPKCKKYVVPNITQKGTQTEARCPECGAFIKWLGKTDVKRVQSLNHNKPLPIQKPNSDTQILINISNQLEIIIELLRRPNE